MPAANPGADDRRDILVLVAHPALQISRVNRRLKAVAADAHARTEVRDLYRLYPDYLVDVAAEQERLAAASLVVWQHPIHWYGPPPLMKLWIDEVLAFGWAYGPGGRALAGKDLWLVATTGGTADSYRPDRHNRHPFQAFLPPYEQTAAMCGMRFLPPLVLHGAHRVPAAEVDAHAERYGQRLATYPRWPELDAIPGAPACDVPEDARPAAAAA